MLLCCHDILVPTFVLSWQVGTLATLSPNFGAP
jgi:hypothetical protein